MEFKGAKLIFHMSVKEGTLKYKPFIGDGDADSYNAVVQTKPYVGHVPVKC